MSEFNYEKFKNADDLVGLPLYQVSTQIVNGLKSSVSKELGKIVSLSYDNDMASGVKAHAIVIQKTGKIKGYAIGDNFTVIPTGVPTATISTPRVKKVDADKPETLAKAASK